jgi:hypothetical protein
MQTLALIAVLLFTVAHADAQTAKLTGKMDRNADAHGT